jgi:hypothetical protein
MHVPLRSCLVVLSAAAALLLTGCGTRPPVKTFAERLPEFQGRELTVMTYKPVKLELRTPIGAILSGMTGLIGLGVAGAMDSGTEIIDKAGINDRLACRGRCLSDNETATAPTFERLVENDGALLKKIQQDGIAKCSAELLTGILG